MHKPILLQSLRNPIFARLYAAQTVNLMGDALTWVGLALLAFELAGDRAGALLSVALTLRVTIYVLLSPVAGVLADRIDRKRIMVVTHLCRTVVICLLPFVSQVWQIYAIVLLLNCFAAFFTPTYQATIPLAARGDDYPQAIALSGATYQLLGVLGPGIAGGVAAFLGTRQVFFLDGFTFLIAAFLIQTLPSQVQATQQSVPRGMKKTLQDISSERPVFLAKTARILRF
ncbi:MAG: MFS transporter [Cyanobacteria bacterium SBC]|nr:MFS transporter [Cyanobacteria bacterium SBC]